MEVTVIMPTPPESKIPRIDSLRNHQWAHSGALYDQLPKTDAEMMRRSLRELHESVGFPQPDPNLFGVFRVDEAAEAVLIANVKRLGLEAEVGLLPENDSRKLARDFYLAGFRHYATSDKPFDEAGLLQTARQVAEEEGVRFRAAEVVKLIEDPSSACGMALVLRIGGVAEKLLNWRSDYIVLCAGSQIPKLLESISVQHRLQVFQSALLTIDNNRYLDAALFVDRVSEFAVVRHKVMPRILPAGALVVGARYREPVLDPSEERIVTNLEKRAIVRLLPPSLWCRAEGAKATAGHKTENMDENGQPSVAPFVTNVPGYERVLYGIPGKASLAYWAAGHVVERFKQLNTRARGSSGMASERLANQRTAADELPNLAFEYRMHHTHQIDEIERTKADVELDSKKNKKTS
jgi:hypothetical protein